ncbi:hypothetical protein Godav_001605 [Gossypium davidsonii]|uniref:Uncharacterized protein n=1 Tax=Gossypium davidsonii TaxID=34287 RepID=A0A7J8T434_GOSDV|nr:hypothetical protein [Gossypium davidsonii]
MLESNLLLMWRISSPEWDF